MSVPNPGRPSVRHCLRGWKALIWGPAASTTESPQALHKGFSILQPHCTRYLRRLLEYPCSPSPSWSTKTRTKGFPGQSWLEAFYLALPNVHRLFRPYVPILVQEGGKNRLPFRCKKSQQNSLLPLSLCVHLWSTKQLVEYKSISSFTLCEEASYKFKVQQNIYMT